MHPKQTIIDINYKTMRKYLSTLLVASVLIAGCSKDSEVIREKIVSQSRPILSGQGQPDNDKGEDGDYYLDLTNAKLYGPKTKGVWGEPSLDLRGLSGKDGKDGKDGQNGQDGQPGRDGQNGANGTNGESPRIGDNGNWWVGNTDLGVKAQGTPGQNGRDGQNGTNGVTPRIGENGNWWVGDTDLGVKAQGNSGQNGRDGRDGQNGTNGVAPHIGDNGNWWVGDQDTGKPARGAQGERGIPGVNGRDGNNGFTPYIGPNGNWWVDNRDTGKPARGERGQTGAAGQNGVDGSKILAEDRAPQATDGVKGDYFIDKAAKIFYGPKTDAGWPTTGISLVANQVMTTDYELSEDGKTLVKWLNPKTHYIDMNTDPKLKEVEIIAKDAFNAEKNGLMYELRTFVIGDKVKEIKTYAFYQCIRLTSVELSNENISRSITKIEPLTFGNCTHLQNVDIPSSVTTIETRAFVGCDRLSSIILPEKVNSIASKAFMKCKSLHTIIIQNPQAFVIDAMAFNQTLLRNIYVPDGKADAYKNINIRYKEIIR